jgi:hypothetical protein
MFLRFAPAEALLTPAQRWFPARVDGGQELERRRPTGIAG